MPHCRTEEEAEARAKLLGQLAKRCRLAIVGEAQAVEALKIVAAVRDA
jgi:hypothetical protein